MTSEQPFGPSRSPLVRELARKAFHMLSLLYLFVYKTFGPDAALQATAAWTVIVFAVETARLLSPRLNRALTSFFGGLARAEEADKYSGIMHTTLGALLVFRFFGDNPTIVSAAIYYVAFGDAAAALIGKSFGRHRIRPGKSLEGSLACFSTCAAAGAGLGIEPGAVFFSAAAATLVELVPTSRWFNDNLWIPVVTATVIRLCAGY
jgi:dolichol kinase